MKVFLLFIYMTFLLPCCDLLPFGPRVVFAKYISGLLLPVVLHHFLPEV
jgi:hypothetical protein